MHRITALALAALIALATVFTAATPAQAATAPTIHATWRTGDHCQTWFLKRWVLRSDHRWYRDGIEWGGYDPHCPF